MRASIRQVSGSMNCVRGTDSRGLVTSGNLLRHDSDRVSLYSALDRVSVLS